MCVCVFECVHVRAHGGVYYINNVVCWWMEMGRQYTEFIYNPTELI